MCVKDVPSSAPLLHASDLWNVLTVQDEASFTQGLFYRPSCHGNELEAEFLQCIISTLLNEEKLLMVFFCDLKFLLIK